MRCSTCLLTMAAGLLAAGTITFAEPGPVRYTNVPSQFAYTAPTHDTPHARSRAAIPPGTSDPAAERTARDLAEADRLAGQQEWDQAAALVNRALADFPDDADLLSRAGHYYMMKRSLAVSESYWARLATLYPDNAWAQACWGGMLARLGFVDQAQAVLEKALALNPREIVARFHMAGLRLAQGDADAARLALRSLNLLECGTCAAWIRDESDLLEKAIGLQGLRQLCAIVLAGGETAAATEVDVLHMDTPHLRDAMGHVAEDVRSGYQSMQKKDWSAAEESLTRATTDGLTAPSVTQGIAYCRVMRNDPAKAYTLMAELADRHADNAFVQFKFGMLCMDQGRFAEAAGAFLRAHKITPDDLEVTINLAGACSALALNDEAWQHLGSIPPAERPTWFSWFNQPQPHVRNLRQDPRFAAWAVQPVSATGKIQD